MSLDKRTVTWFVAAFAIVVGLQLLIQKKENKDIRFCRNLLIQLSKGSLDAEAYIDWNNFKGFDYDVGTEYKKITKPNEKSGYRSTFIKGFSLAFEYFKAQMNWFSNWRIYSQTGSQAVVACDNAKMHKTLLFTVSRKGEFRKLVAIQWKT